jgi:hypothetical protein
MGWNRGWYAIHHEITIFNSDNGAACPYAGTADLAVFFHSADVPITAIADIRRVALRTYDIADIFAVNTKRAV